MFFTPLKQYQLLCFFKLVLGCKDPKILSLLGLLGFLIFKDPRFVRPRPASRARCIVRPQQLFCARRLVRLWPPSHMRPLTCQRQKYSTRHPVRPTSVWCAASRSHPTSVSHGLASVLRAETSVRPPACIVLRATGRYLAQGVSFTPGRGLVRAKAASHA